MNYQVRYLTTETDFAEANDIFKSHKKVMRDNFDRSNDSINSNLDPNAKFLGCYFEGVLVAFLKVTFWDKLPVYVVGNMNIKKTFLQRYDFSNHKHPIIPIMNFILAEQEANKRYTWYYNRSLEKSYHKLQFEGKDLLKNCVLGWDSNKQQYRYERFIEEVVTAGNLPVAPAHKLLQGKVFNTDYMIVKCCLKNEYRDTPDYFDDRVIEECLKNTKKIKDT